MEKGIRRREFIRKMALVPAATLFPAYSWTASANMNHRNPTYAPSYIHLHKTGELKARGETLMETLKNCTICPRECGTNRLGGLRGDCKANGDLEVSSATPHFGEEPELVGQNGSGTIFFTNCSLHCVFCINFETSHLGHGSRSRIRDLASMMLMLQRRGCHNINLVTPSHYAPHILLALDRAAGRGLNIPVVYNTCGWEKMDILTFLDGVVDVYLADFKYADSGAANTYSPGAANYVDITQKALLEMHRQVGVAKTDPHTGLMVRGLMIRHLVMPNNVARSDRVVRWVARNMPHDTYLNIMSQYTPMFKAFDYPEISRRITRTEYSNVVTIAQGEGLTNLRLQMSP